MNIFYMGERENIIRISLAKGLKYNTIFQLFQKYKSATEIILNINDIVGKREIKEKFILPSIDETKKNLEKINKMNVEVVTFVDDNYSDYLKITNSYPFVLYCKGNVKLLNNKKNLSIIGSRTTSINNIKYTEKISEEIGKYGYIIVSGMAKGIDAAAHRGAIKTGTIAVLGSGIDVIYPRENTKLYQDIIQNNGLIISEFPIGSSPKPEHFPQRNRIIAGLSKGVLIVDAGKISGTLQTANQALRFNREVMAFPGNPFDEKYKGSNELIRNGASLVSDTADILENLENSMFDSSLCDYSIDYEIEDKEENNKKELDNYVFDELTNENESSKNLENFILSKLDYSPLNINELIESIKAENAFIKHEKISSSISRLELSEKIIIDNGTIFLKLTI